MSERARSGCIAVVSALLVSTLAGCGNGLASVTGRVTVDGEPLAASDTVRGNIYYYPEGGTGAPAVGLLEADGGYRLRSGSQEGVSPGAYLVTISATEIIPAKIPGGAASGRSITPRRYADPSKSGLRVTVAEGSNEFDFDLDGTPDPPSKKRRRRR